MTWTSFDSLTTPSIGADLTPPGLLIAYGLADLLIGLVLLGLPLFGWRIARRHAGLRSGLLPLGGAVLLALAAVHLVSVASIYVPVPGLVAAVKVVAMLLTLWAGIVLWRRLPRSLAWPALIRRRSGRMAAELGRRRRAADALARALGEIEQRTARHPGDLQIDTTSGVVGTPSDHAAHEENEARLQRYADELHRSNMELEQFASIASHDLQEPLRMVIGYCELLQRRYHGKLDDDANTFIEFAVDGARRMQGLISDLLTYSRVGSRPRVPVAVEPAEAIEDALDNLKRAVEESGAKVTYRAPPTVLCDPSQLTQLFQNLIGNAIKYRSTAAPEIRIDGRLRGEFVGFSIRDNGIGIEKRYAERIFEIFKRLHTRDAYPGSGIGLAICKRIVDRHGGHIWLDCDVPAGSCFRFTLPAAEVGERPVHALALADSA